MWSSTTGIAEPKKLYTGTSASVLVHSIYYSEDTLYYVHDNMVKKLQLDKNPLAEETVSTNFTTPRSIKVTKQFAYIGDSSFGIYQLNLEHDYSEEYYEMQGVLGVALSGGRHLLAIGTMIAMATAILTFHLL